MPTFRNLRTSYTFVCLVVISS